MKRGMFTVLTLTPELSLSLKHWQQMDAVQEDKAGIIEKRFGRELAMLVEKIYDRVGRDVKDRIVPITKSIDDDLRGMARIDWTQRNIESNWGAYGDLYSARGPKKRLAYLGVYLTGWKGKPHLILVVWPNGGDGGQKRFLDEWRQNRRRDLDSMKDKLEDWPGWEQGPAIIFHSHAIDEWTTLDKLKLNASQAAAKFLKFAIPILRKLVAASG